MAGIGKERLTQAQREEITRRVLAGEKAATLAPEFNVSRAYISLLKNQALDPGRFIKEQHLTKKLTEPEMEKFRKVLSATTPTDHDFRPHSEHWSLESGFQLAEKLFKKRPSKRVVTECVSPHIPERNSFKFTRPQPPKPHHIGQISPEFASDPDYVAYYLSPICEQIAWREYELALADYEARFAGDEERMKAEREEGFARSAESPVFSQTGKRTGKHAKGAGSPFTKPKRRKRR